MDVGSFKNAALGSSAPPRSTVPTAAVSVGEDRRGQDKTQQGAALSSPQPSDASVEEAVSTIQSFVQSVRRNLDFQLDDSSGRVVVKVTDSESGDVVRQIPSEEALRLAESLQEVRSLLFKAEA